VTRGRWGDARAWLVWLAAASCGYPVRATDYTVPANGSDTTQKTVSGTDTVTVGLGGKLSVNKKAAIDWNGAATDLKITNSGTIESTKADGRAIDASGGDNNRSLTLENKKDAIIKSASDAVRINVNPTGGAVTVNNAGTIQSSIKRALDFEAASSGAATITINNAATGTIKSDADDAIRPGQGATVNNSGTIRTNGQAADKADGIDFKAATAGTVNNNDSGTISGARHGVTLSGSNGSGSVTVKNAANATITGRNGSGVGSDAGGTVTNYGTIEGAYSGDGTQDGDGDGVDIDYAGTITNYGTIKGTGAGGYDSGGRANNSEGISIGGGTITNSGTISGARYGIVVNNDSNHDNTRSGVAATTITNKPGARIEGKDGYAIRLENKLGTAADNDTIVNRGTIIGSGTIPDPTAVVTLQNGSVDGGSVGTLDGVTYTGTGSARFIRGDGAAIQMGQGDDVLTNYSTITGNSGRAISLEGGDDTLNLYTGSTVTGRIDGGTGTDTINLDKESLGPDTGTLANVINFESLNVKGGTWKLLDDQAYTRGATITAGATLRIGDGATSGSITADIANNGALVFDRTDATSYAGTISGTGSLTKVNTGTLTLSTAHSYTGTTAVSGGALNIRNAGALGAADGTAATGTTVASGAALELQGGIAVGNEALSLAGTGVSNGGALRSVSGANSYAGAITLTADSRINADADTLTLSGGISGAARAYRNLTLGGAGDGVVSGAVSGNIGSVTKDGAGTWTLTGASTLAVNVSVEGGALRLAGGGSVSDRSAYVGDSSGTTGSATVTGASSRWTSSGSLLVGSSGTGTLTVADGGSVSDSTAYIGYNSGSTGSATVTGTSSRWTTSGNFYLGSSGAGTLTVADGGAVSVGGGTGTLTVARDGRSTGTLIIGAAAGQVAVAAGTVQAGEVRFGLGTGTLVFNHTGNPDGTAVTFAPKITGGGTVNHLAGTTILTGANTYTGATTISGGVLNIRNATALGAADGTAANGTTVASGAALELQGGIAVGDEALSIAGSGVSNGGALRSVLGTNSYAGAITLTDDSRINADADTLTLSGGISGAAGANRNLTLGGAGDGKVSGAIAGNVGFVVKDGTGTWTLTGQNTLGNSLHIESGALRLEAGGTVSSATGFVATRYGSSGSATVTGTGSSWTVDRNISVGYQGAGTLAVAAGGTVSVGTNGTGTVTVADQARSTGTLAIGAAPGETALAAGTVQAGAVHFGAGTGALVFNHTGNPDGTAVTFAPTITGGGTVNHRAGTTILTGANTYTGTTTVSGGVLNIRNSTALGAADGTAANGTTVASGATLELQGGIAAGNEALSIDGIGATAGGSLRSVSGTNSFAGPITLTNHSRIHVDAGTLTLSGGISGAAGLDRDLTLAGAGDGVVSGAIAGNIGRLYKEGAGSWTLTGQSTLSGDVSIIRGALRLEAGGSLSSVGGHIASMTGLLGAATVTGTGSRWTLSGGLYVGDLGTNTLTVADGGLVSAQTGVVGFSGSGRAAVAGANSRLTLSDDLYVGYQRTGTLTVADGGTVSVGTNGGGTVTVAHLAGSTGTLAIGAAPGDAAVAAGTVQAGAVHFGDGTGKLVFNHIGNPDGSAVTFAPTISGRGSVSHLAGTTILTAASTYTGTTTVSGGTLSAANAAALGSSAATVTAGGTLDINGVTLANTLTLSGTGVGGVGALTGTGAAGISGAITLAGNAALGGTGALTVSRPIGDGGNGFGLTKVGTGTVILTAASTYTGRTTVAAGTLTLSGGGSVAAARGVAVATGATFDVSGVSGTGTAVAGLSDTAAAQAGTVVLGSKTLTLASAADSFGGTIAGAGGLIVTGGTQTLTGASTYTGGTRLDAGTLRIASDASLGDAAGPLSFGGGTLATTASVATARSAALGAGGGTLAPAAGTVLTASGVFSGPGPLTLSGAGTLTLTGANTYTGATAISAGATLRLGDGGTAGAIAATAAVTDDGTLVFDRADAVSFAPAIAGSGGLTQVGTGTTILTGRSTYAGPTTVAAGTLQIDGVLAASEVTVRRGGTLAGSGKIGDPLIEAGGRLAPGSTDAIGTLSIHGPLTFAAGSFYTVKVTPTAGDRTAVTGPVTIQGGTVQVLAGAGTYTPALRYTLLTATGGVTGQFSSLQTTGSLAFLTPSLAYDGASVSLGFAQTAPLVSAATTPNQAATAAALNGTGPIVTTAPATSAPTAATAGPARPGPVPSVRPRGVAVDAAAELRPVPTRSTAVAADGTVTTTVTSQSGTTVVVSSPAAQVTTAVLNQTSQGAVQALTALSGEVHATDVAVAAQNAALVQGVLLDRLRIGPADPVGPDSPAGRFAPGTALPAAYAAFTAEEPAVGLVPVAPARPNATLWGQGLGVVGATRGTGNAARVSRETGGFVMGLETGFGALALPGLTDIRVGVAAGTTSTTFEIPARLSSGQVETAFGALYARAGLGPVQVRAGAIYGEDALDTRRRIAFPGFAQSASGRTGGALVQGFGEIGYPIAVGSAVLEPFVGGAALRLRRDSLAETGGAAALAVFGRSVALRAATAGIQAQAVVADAFGGAGPLLIRGLVGYRRAFGDVTPTALLAYRGGRAFAASGMPIDRDAALASASLDWQVAPGLQVGLAYDGQTGFRAEDHAVRGNLTLRW
jgi:fibronectin-binding autotransporter adhesin